MAEKSSLSNQEGQAVHSKISFPYQVFSIPIQVQSPNAPCMQIYGIQLVGFDGEMNVGHIGLHGAFGL